MSTKAYCGISGKLPKGLHVGSMSECADANQIRRYGLYKVDSMLIRPDKAKMRKKQLEYERLRGSVLALDTKLTRLKKQFDQEKDTAKKAKMQTEGKKLQLDHKTKYQKLLSLKKELDMVKPKVAEKQKAVPKSFPKADAAAAEVAELVADHAKSKQNIEETTSRNNAIFNKLAKDIKATAMANKVVDDTPLRMFQRGRQDKGTVRCNVCDTTLSEKTRLKHLNTKTHLKNLKASGKKYHIN